MSVSRSRRNTKVVNYAAVVKDNNDDEDFGDFTPPSKKIKESKKKLESKKDSSPDRIETSVKPFSRDKSPKQRLSLEEMKFQKELLLALELSAVNSEGFQGFNKENEEKCEDLECFSPLRNSVVTVEVHAVPSEEDTYCKEITDLPKEITDLPEERPQKTDTNLLEKDLHKTGTDLLEKSQQMPNTNQLIEKEQSHAKDSLVLEELVPSTSDGFTEKRQRKKVNFVEDDSEDDWSENEIKTASKSETDESDYFPSPTKSKKKKEIKKPAKNSKMKEPPTSKKKEPPTSKTSPIRRPLRSKQISSEDFSVVNSIKLTKSEPEIKIVKMAAKSNCKVGSEEFIKETTLPLKSNDLNDKPLGITNTSLCDVKPQGLTNRTFKSPTMSSPSNCKPSPKTPSGIGLRLGLSRKVFAKPLHPNASVK